MSRIKRSSLRNTCLVFVLFLFASTFSLPVFATDNPCDTKYSSIDANGDFRLSPSKDMTGVTDTTNLQCITNAIENLPFHTVKLKNGDYYIKEISLNCPSSKACTFAGTTRAGTVLNVVDDSIDCQGKLDNNIATGGLSFRGNITVQFLTISGDSPCMGDGFLPGLIVFTGAPAVIGGSCANSVLFGFLNRVDIFASGSEIDAGVLVYTQGRYFENTCQDGLSGTFTSTRTAIDGLGVGIFLSMQSGARVSLDFLDIVNTAFGVFILDSNAVTAVNFCKINLAATLANDMVAGVIVARGPGAPTTNTTNINNCTFNLKSDPGTMAARGVFVLDEDSAATMPTVVSANTFNLQGDESFGIEFYDVPNCTITGNRFTGDGGSAIAIFSTNGTEVTGCTVTANTGIENMTTVFAPIYASTGTSDNVLGPHPGVFMLDDGCNFNLNDADGGCGLTGPVVVKSSSSTEQYGSAPPRQLTPDYLPVAGYGINRFRRALNRHKMAN